MLLRITPKSTRVCLMIYGMHPRTYTNQTHDAVTLAARRMNRTSCCNRSSRPSVAPVHQNRFVGQRAHMWCIALILKWIVRPRCILLMHALQPSSATRATKVTAEEESKTQSHRSNNNAYYDEDACHCSMVAKKSAGGQAYWSMKQHHMDTRDSPGIFQSLVSTTEARWVSHNMSVGYKVAIR
jgi:hypothetical protein